MTRNPSHPNPPLTTSHLRVWTSGVPLTSSPMDLLSYVASRSSRRLTSLHFRRTFPTPLHWLVTSTSMGRVHPSTRKSFTNRPWVVGSVSWTVVRGTRRHSHLPLTNWTDHSPRVRPSPRGDPRSNDQIWFRFRSPECFFGSGVVSYFSLLNPACVTECGH